MSDVGTGVRSKRTAILVVHGMGIQRPLETVRAVVNAIWLDDDSNEISPKKLWTHPELSRTDIDLPVISTNSLAGGTRATDFHELYWSHLMTETPAIAVLLWLFELVRRGPHLKSGMGMLWWSGAVFLSFLMLSLAVIVVRAIIWFAQLAGEPQSVIFEPALLLAIVAAVVLFSSLGSRAFRLARRSAVLLLLSGVAVAFLYYTPHIDILSRLFIPLLVAIVATRLLMGHWGLRALGGAYAISVIFYAIFITLFAARDAEKTHQLLWVSVVNQLKLNIPDGYFPWSSAEGWTAVAASLVIGTYLILSAAFLQPFLGDAARYFRNSPSNVKVRREIRKQAVDTLEDLHISGSYDRIIVVAHSLGSVIAYDMLRSYFGRICKDIPTDAALFGPEFDLVDSGEMDVTSLRLKARTLVHQIARAIANFGEQRPQGADGKVEDVEKPKGWLVTDFVTLGSPLTHALYLLCQGNTEMELQKDFDRRVREREFPKCPPERIDGDGRLTFKDPHTKKRRFHHGAQFGLTRWTNLFFPMSELFWGDAIGGPLMAIFGAAVVDVPVFTNEDKRADFFTHTTYLDTAQEGRHWAPHIVALKYAIDLTDDSTHLGGLDRA